MPDTTTDDVDVRDALEPTTAYAPGGGAGTLCRLLELGELRTVMRLAPRLDGVVVDRARWIGHHEIQVELDHVPEGGVRFGEVEGMQHGDPAFEQGLDPGIAGRLEMHFAQLVVACLCQSRKGERNAARCNGGDGQLYCGPVMRHPAAPVQAANFSSAI